MQRSCWNMAINGSPLWHTCIFYKHFSTSIKPSPTLRDIEEKLLRSQRNTTFSKLYGYTHAFQQLWKVAMLEWNSPFFLYIILLHTPHSSFQFQKTDAGPKLPMMRHTIYGTCSYKSQKHHALPALTLWILFCHSCVISLGTKKRLIYSLLCLDQMSSSTAASAAPAWVGGNFSSSVVPHTFVLCPPFFLIGWSVVYPVQT